MKSGAEEEKSLAFSRIEEKWRAEGIAYGIVSGYLEDGEELGRDLDIAIAARDLPVANRIAGEVLRELGWRVKEDQRPWAWWLFAFKEVGEELEGFEIDLLPRLQSGINSLQQGVSQFARAEGRYGWQVDPRGSVIKRVILQIIAGNFSKFKKTPAYLQLSPLEEEVVRNDPRLSEVLAGSFFIKEGRGTLAELPGLRRVLKKRLYAMAARRPVAALEAAIFGVKRSIRLNLLAGKVTPVLAVSSLPDSDREEVIEKLRRKLVRVAFLKPVEHGDSSSGTRDCGLKGMTRLRQVVASWWVDQFAVNRHSVRLRTVIYARHPVQDLLNDHLGGVSGWSGSFFAAMTRKVPLSFVLVSKTGPGVQKPEAVAATLELFQKRGWVDRVIEIDQGEEEAAELIFEEILASFLVDES